MAPPPKDQKRPTGQIPAQSTGKSSQGLPQVGRTPTSGQIPVQGTGNSAQGLPKVGARTSTSGGQIPAQGTGKSAQGLPQVRTTTGEIKLPRTTSGSIPVQSGPKKPGDDAFASWSAGRKRANFIASPTNPGRMKEVVEEEWIDPEWNPDGSAPLPDLDLRDSWRAVKSPFTSKIGERTKDAYEKAFKQFAIGFNPRYEEDGPGKPRGHIYVWDVSRAMGCEIPHFVGARELTLSKTIEWLRHEGPMRQWLKISESDSFRWADLGMLVVAVPRDPKINQLAIVVPQAEADVPLLTGAGLVVGALLPAHEVLGTTDFDCYYHA